MPVCPNCGQDNPDIAKFCLACGTSLAAATPPVAEEERRLVTAVFTDLVGSTSRGEQLDPEDVRSMLAPYYARVRRELEAHGGTVEKFIGDAVVGVFGAPVSHEDDPERAVRAALAVGRAIEELNEADPWLNLRIRTAVNTGEALVVLDARVDEGEGIAAGDVMNTAARLQGAAPVNGVVVGELTHRATRHAIEYRELDPVPAKGKAEPVRVWEVVALKDASPVATETPLLGRAAELEELRRLWETARAERRRLLATLIGPPGIGKSRLVAEFSDIAAASGAVHTGRCLSYGEGITYWPVTEIVKSAAGILQSDDAETGAAKLGALLDGLPTTDQDELRTVAAAVANLVGGAATPRGTYTASEISRSELHWGVRRFLELLAQQRPLLVVFEDLHWAEPTLLDLIAFVVDGSAPAPLLIVASARPELLDLPHAVAHPGDSRHRLELDALDEPESRALLAELAGADELPPRLIETVLQHSAGNPLFIEETVRMLADENLLATGASAAELEALPIPANLQALIGSRLDRLPRGAKRVAQHAALAGSVFWSGAVAALTGGNGEIDESLAELERRDIIRRREASSVADESEYAFKHVLIRDVAYSRLPKSRRVELHARFADWIEAIPGPAEEFVEIVAYHLEQSCRLAGEIARSPIVPPTLRATNALAQAAEKAERREGMREADRYIARALELVGDEEPERAAELRLRLGGIHVRLGDLTFGSEQLIAVAAAAHALGRDDLRTEAFLLLAAVDQRQGRATEARERLNDAQRLAQSLDDSRLQIRVAFLRSSVEAELGGTFAAAAAELREAIAAADAIGDPSLRVMGRLRMAFLLFNAGQLAAAEEELGRCIELADQLGSLRDQARAVFLLGLAKYYRGERDEAERLNLQAREWLERTCETFFQIQNFRALGLYALARDDAHAAERWLREAIPVALEEGGRPIFEVYRFLAEALARQRRLDDAADLIEFARRDLPKEDVIAQAYILLAEGEIAARSEDEDRARKRYEEGINQLVEQGLPIEAGEARIAYARSLRRFGDSGTATAQLELARAELASAGATGLVAEIDRDLVELTSGAGAAGPASS